MLFSSLFSLFFYLSQFSPTVLRTTARANLKKKNSSTLKFTLRNGVFEIGLTSACTATYDDPDAIEIGSRRPRDDDKRRRATVENASREITIEIRYYLTRENTLSRTRGPIGALPRKNIEHWWVGWMARA